MEVADDALAKVVFFLSTTESRSKLYRLLQYGSKFSKWALIEHWKLDASEPTLTHTLHSDNGSKKTSAPYELKIQVTPDWKRRTITSLSRVELIFGDARRFFRFLQFLEMADIFRYVREPLRRVRVLRRLRILCFFFFYLTENYVVICTRVLGASSREPLMRRLRRICNGFWLLSILLAFPLDHMMHRGTMLSTAKKLLELPLAFVGFSGLRVSDEGFSALGLISAQIGVYSRWVDVMAKFQQQHLKRLPATPDVL
ncbi:Peroxisomal biogenesis factor 11 (PEX11) [Phytophthora infestans]|uniref:Peroxisomal biogenesis factor 11 (PEX11) n=1 Tax=Phytophthora infestans TaxID=4787 RepID=A0A8S9TGC4_PHYIN|nr:Peroxisomal biogenesis factor 11 (PEX11) [Phytophthora infestans]